jgi:hypothetical protein
MIRIPFSALLAALLALGCAQSSPQASSDPLPSWNEGTAKQAITSFVTRVTQKDGPDFVSPADRIATFDNDGTLWSEKPVPFQLVFAFDRVRAMAPQHPQWKTKELFASLLRVVRAALDAAPSTGRR